MTIQEIISNLVKNRWSYGDIARQSGVSKATISRWHGGVCKPNKVLEEKAIKELEIYVDADKFDDQAGTLSYSFPTWDEVEKRIFTDDYYEKAISYHKKVIEELEKSRNAKKWRFTEDEKVILRNLDKEYKYIIRDNSGILYVFREKPFRDCYGNVAYKYGGEAIKVMNFSGYDHLFKNICFRDTEPCEFRKFI